MKIGILRQRYVAHGGGERFAHRFLEAATGQEVHIFAHLLHGFDRTTRQDV